MTKGPGNGTRVKGMLKLMITNLALQATKGERMNTPKDCIVAVVELGSRSARKT
jgi:hypothetical protein